MSHTFTVNFLLILLKAIVIINIMAEKSEKIKWRQKIFVCNYCKKQMKNASKSRHLQLCIPKTLEKKDDFTDEEKQLIDKEFAKMMKRKTPYHNKLKQHFD